MIADMSDARARRRIDEIGEESRRRILDAAEELFAERGFDRTSFVDISERSGISRGSIPWHFTNKDGLMIAVIERATERAMGTERYEGITQAEDTPSLSDVFQDYGNLVRSENSALLFMMLTEALRSTGPIHTQYQGFLSNGRRGLEMWLRTHRPVGVDSERAKAQETAIATALSGALIGIHLQALVEPDAFNLEDALSALGHLLDTHLETVWDIPVASGKKKPSKKRRTS